MGRLITVLLLLIGATAAVFYLIRDHLWAGAAIFGGITALLNLLLLSWRAQRTEKLAGPSARLNLRHFYLSALERFAAVAFMFALGLVALRLPPVPLLVGFVVGMFTLFTLDKTKREKRTNHGN